MSHIVVTGANRGLGLEFCRQYAVDNNEITAVVRTASAELEVLAKSNSLRIVKTNLTDDDSLRAALAETAAGTVDVLINNAGTMGYGSFAEAGTDYQAFGSFDRSEWLNVFNINVCTPMAVTEILVDALARAKAGRVVTLSSMVGSNAWNTIGNLYGYRASKAAVNSIMKSMGVNLLDQGIVAVALQPGWVRTEMGGPNAEWETPEAVAVMRKTISGLTLEDAGRLLTNDGNDAPY